MPKSSFTKWLKTEVRKVGDKLTRSRSPTPSRRDGTPGRHSTAPDRPYRGSSSVASPTNLTDSGEAIHGPSTLNSLQHPLVVVSINPTSNSSGTSNADQPKDNLLSPPIEDFQSSSTVRSERSLSEDVDNDNTKGAASPGRLTTWVVGLQNVLALVEKVSDVFPPLKSTVAGINALIEAKDAFSSNQEEFEKLHQRVELLEDILKGCSDADLPQDIRDRRDGLERSIKHLGETLEKKTHRGGLTRVAYTKEDQQDIMRIVREMTFAIELAMLDVTVRNETRILQAVNGIEWLKDRTIEELRGIRQELSSTARGVEILNKAELFKRLGDARNYAFTRGGRRKGCVTGSRITLLSQLLTWAEDSTTSHAFWLSGIAGSGKTAVSETFCLQLSKREMLGASFFCSLASQDLRDVYLIIPSLARALAHARPQFGDALAAVLASELSSDMNPLEMTLQEQYDCLLLRPAKVAFQYLQQPVVLCVDAIDECSDTGALKEFLDAVVLSKPAVPLKIFLTSRPEYTIRERMESSSYSSCHGAIRLHDIDRDIIQADIQLFVNRSLEKIPVLREHYGGNWPPPEVQKIVKQSGTLFIVAATFIRYIDDESGNRIDRFLLCAGVHQGDDDGLTHSGIEDLYRSILERVFKNLSHKEVQDVCACLRLLVVARRPLLVEEYAALLNRPEVVIREAFRSLYSVIEVARGRPISIYHASFVEFLGTRHPATQSVWFVDPSEAQSMATDLCLGLMDSDDTNKGVSFGISGAVTSYRSNVDQPSKLALRSELTYACTSWGDHALRAMPLSDELESKLSTFLDKKAVFWIEALSVEKQVGARSTTVLWELAQEVRDHHLKKLLLGIRDFCQVFGTPINHSAPHLYLSALPFLEPTMGSLLDHWKPPAFHSLPMVYSRGKPAVSDRRILIQQSGKVWCLCVSYDGTTVISGSEDGTVQMWNMLSGEHAFEPLEQHPAPVTSVASSFDGSTLCTTYDKMIAVWDARSGCLLLDPLEGHEKFVTCAAFSRDGSKIVSGSSDKTVRVWSTQTGASICNPLVGHTQLVTSVAFTPDGSKIISGSRDTTIRIWDAQTGTPILKPLNGHRGGVNAIAISPTGHAFASGSCDTTVCLWDTRDGSPLQVPRLVHGSWVTSIAFSSDGTKLVSGSNGHTVRVWDVQSGELLLTSPNDWHQGPVTSVAFSQDGRKIISGSDDKTIAIWDAPTEEAPPPNPSEQRATCRNPTSLTFSVDGSRIISGSYDQTVWIWNAESGERVMDPLAEHTGPVTSLALSPDGTLIVTGSKNNTLRLWDAQSGEPRLDPFEGDTGYITSIAFSPDGSKIVTASDDNYKLRIWDVGSRREIKVLGAREAGWKASRETTTSVIFSHDGSGIVSGSSNGDIVFWDSFMLYQGQRRVLQAHTGLVTSLVRSPNGSTIVSTSVDKTIGVWNARDGTPIVDPLEDHTQAVNSVAFSPDGSMMVSGSNDATIIVWDTQSWTPLMKPLEGHRGPITSVAFSPDGTRIVSGSNDDTVRVWRLLGYGGTIPSPTLLHRCPIRTVSMNDAGWVCNASDCLLLWVPPQLRRSLFIPPVELVIGPAHSILIDLSHASAHGANWLKCKEPPTDSDMLWPIGYIGSTTSQEFALD